MDWNALQTENLYEGQRLVLKQTRTVEPAVKTPTPPKTEQKTKKYHTVKSGDTLGKIAARYHLSLAQLKKLNPGKGNVIKIGDKIRVK
jgi:LysM repeat protein